MATYAIGDLQGCLDALRQLLECIAFDPSQDQLWFVGDLVNRGPQSLETLRFVRDLGACAVTVLGNHDLHLLAIHAGVHRVRPKDTVQSILQAPDREALMHWLQQRPLLHHDPALDWVMIHAGLPPQWDLATAKAAAQEFCTTLQGPQQRLLLERMYGDSPRRWHSRLSYWQRLRFTSNCLTRLRYCTRSGHLDMHHKGPPGTQPTRLVPWFAAPQRAHHNLRIVFGHWSTLGYYQDAGARLIGLDTGCVWGGKLTAVRLDGPAPQRIQINCPAQQTPGKAAATTPSR